MVASVMRRTRARRLRTFWYVHAMLALLWFGWLQVSTIATHNPAYHPQTGHRMAVQQDQQQQQLQEDYPSQYYQPQQQDVRGGSTLTKQPMEQQQLPTETTTDYHYRDSEETFHPPKVLLKHMSTALRVTSEWNRRLHKGINRFKSVWGRPKPQLVGGQDPTSHEYGDHPVNISPSRLWQPPIEQKVADAMADPELSLFHASEPRQHPDDSKDDDGCEKGVEVWGPEMESYLEHIVESLDAAGVEIPLAMIYLDRACSVETPRSNGVPSCPFCTPRTVHRLSVVALILAKEAISGIENLEHYYGKLKSLGIPMSQLQPMVDWMRGALGDPGLLVTVAQMKEWSKTWDAIFYPNRQSQSLPPRHEEDKLEEIQTTTEYRTEDGGDQYTDLQQEASYPYPQHQY